MMLTAMLLLCVVMHAYINTLEHDAWQQPCKSCAYWTSEMKSPLVEVNKIKIVVLVALCIQNASHALFARYAQVRVNG
jgi:hypothetical protein